MLVADDIEEFEKLGMVHYSVLESFNIGRTFIDYPMNFVDIDCIMRTHPGNFVRPELARVKLYFFQCYDLKIRNILSLWGFELAIEKHRSPILEQVRFRVTEREENAFEFLCGGFVAEPL